RGAGGGRGGGGGGGEFAGAVRERGGVGAGAAGRGVVAQPAVEDVVAGAAVERVVTSAAEERVVAGAACDRVGERVAGPGKVAGAGEGQVLDIVVQRVGVERRLHKVRALAGVLGDGVAAGVAYVGVSADP